MPTRTRATNDGEHPLAEATGAETAGAEPSELTQVLAALQSLATRIDRVDTRIDRVEGRDSNPAPAPLPDKERATALATTPTPHPARAEGGDAPAPLRAEGTPRSAGGAANNHADDPEEVEDSDDERNDDDRDGGRPPPATSLIELIDGESRVLPLPHVEQNPFPRHAAFRRRACHYSPAVAGDTLNGDVERRLRSISKDLAKDLTESEMRTLVPALSVLYDLQCYVDDAHQLAYEPVQPAALRNLLADMSQQLAAARELLRERRDELSAATRSANHRAAIQDAIYDQEATITGVRSAMGEFVALSTASRTVSAHVGTIARERSRDARGQTARQTTQRFQPRTAAATLLQGRNQQQQQPHQQGSHGRGGGGGGSSGGGAPPAGEPSGQAYGGRGRSGGGGRGQSGKGAQA